MPLKEKNIWYPKLIDRNEDVTTSKLLDTKCLFNFAFIMCVSMLDFQSFLSWTWSRVFILLFFNPA